MCLSHLSAEKQRNSRDAQRRRERRERREQTTRVEAAEADRQTDRHRQAETEKGKTDKSKERDVESREVTYLWF